MSTETRLSYSDDHEAMAALRELMALGQPEKKEILAFVRGVQVGVGLFSQRQVG